jgi:hypothetical protein
MPSLRYLMLRLYGRKMLQVYDRRKAILVEKPRFLVEGHRFQFCHSNERRYSGRATPDPPISAGKSFSLGSLSFMGSTVSA